MHVEKFEALLDNKTAGSYVRVMVGDIVEAIETVESKDERTNALLKSMKKAGNYDGFAYITAGELSALVAKLKVK